MPKEATVRRHEQRITELQKPDQRNADLAELRKAHQEIKELIAKLSNRTIQ